MNIKLIYGFPTSGKSTFVRSELLQGHVVVDTDDITQAMFPAYWADRARHWDNWSEMMNSVGAKSASIAARFERPAVITNLWNEPFLRATKPDDQVPIDVAYLSTPARSLAIARARGDDLTNIERWAKEALLRVPPLAKRCYLLATIDDFIGTVER